MQDQERSITYEMKSRSCTSLERLQAQTEKRERERQTDRERERRKDREGGEVTT